MRIKNKTNFWWVWSPEGPNDSTVRHGRQFIGGILPFPVPGDIASELEFQGFGIKEHIPGETFDGWEKVGPRWQPIFTVASEEPPAGVLPDIDELPEMLPASWVDLLGKYTASGKLKKAYRGN